MDESDVVCFLELTLEDEATSSKTKENSRIDEIPIDDHNIQVPFKSIY